MDPSFSLPLREERLVLGIYSRAFNHKVNSDFNKSLKQNTGISLRDFFFIM